MKRILLKWLGVETLIQAAVDQRTQELRKEFEVRSSVLLEAAITASGKVAGMVSAKGDENLKSYVDGCFEAFIGTGVN